MRLFLFIASIAVVILAGELAVTHRGMVIPARSDWFAKDWFAQTGAPSEELRPSLATAEAPISRLPLPSPLHVKPTEVAAPAPTTATVASNPLPDATAIPVPPAPEPVVQREKLVLLTEGAYPPFNYRNEMGALAGFDIDVAKVLCVRLNMECEIIARPWDDLVPALRRGEGQAIIASMLIPSDAREKAPQIQGVAFTEHYYSTPGHFAARRMDPADPKERPALAQSRIAVQSGTVHSIYAAHRFQGSTIVQFPRFTDAKAALENGSVDLLFSDRNALLRWIATDGAACCELMGGDYTDVQFFGPGAGIAVRQSDVLLRAKLNSALESIVADGTYARISARYFAQSIY